MNSDLLRQAIHEKWQVSAYYDGHPRQFCPYAIGYRNGEERVLVYQIGGSSRNGPVRAQWKCFVVSNLSSVKLLNQDTWPISIIINITEQLQQCIATVTAQASF